MARRKLSKKYVSPAASEVLAQKAFFERLRIALEKLIGAGYFEKIPKTTLLKCYHVRYPTVKIVVDHKIIVDEKERKKYKEDFNNKLKTFQLKTMTGESISYASFLTEVLLLIQVFNVLPENEYKKEAGIKALLKPYFEGEWYSRNVSIVYSNLNFFNYEYFDFYKGAVQFIFSELRTIKPGGSNVLQLCRVPHQLASAEIDHVIRPISRLGYLPSNGTKWDKLAFISAEQLGLENFETNEKLPIYIQHHALRRYQERSLSSMGLAFIHLGYQLVFSQNHATVVRNSHILLAYYAGKYKIGYFVVTHHLDKWIVRTFLLLTNEGTPEGEKLKELTALNKIDAQYLKIDTMQAFINYDIEGNEMLFAIFKEAGCASLFEYAKFFDRTNKKIKNADFISKYLSIVGSEDEY